MAEVIAGRNPVLEALKAGRSIDRVLLDKNARRHSAIAEVLALARARDIPVERVDGAAIERQAPGAVHQGIIACAAARDYFSLEELLAVPEDKAEAPLFLILDGIEDPQNLGSILRTAEATGFHGVIVRSRRAVGLTPAVAKASAGAIEYVPVARVANISQAIEALKKQGIWVVGIDMKGELAYTGVDFAPPTAIVVGGEGKGLSHLVRQRCDVIAAIPMKGKIGSLNASVAAAVVMYEALNQRAGDLTWQGAGKPHRGIVPPLKKSLSRARRGRD